MVKHPGRVLAEDFMTPLAITANHLATQIGVNRSTVGRLIAGDQRMTPEMAARLGAYFGVPARWWLSMQLEFDERQIEEHPEKVSAVKPWVPDPDVLLTPDGVMRLPAPEQLELEPAPSLPGGPPAENPPDDDRHRGNRQVRVVRYDNGSIALVGEAP